MTTVPKGTDQWNRKIQGMIEHLTPRQLSAIRANRAENLRRMQEMADSMPAGLLTRQRDLVLQADEAFALQSVRPR